MATSNNPKILIVTPEVTFLPDRMSSRNERGVADMSLALVKALHNIGADIHVAIPEYRSQYKTEFSSHSHNFNFELPEAEQIDHQRIHLAKDSAFKNKEFCRTDCDQATQESDNIRLSLIFQREVINNVIPQVTPDLIHCNDWMTSLIPAVARVADIPCLFTIHNFYSAKAKLSDIRDIGIDVGEIWNQFYFEQMPHSLEETMHSNVLDFITSGIFAAHFVNTISPTFLLEILDNKHTFIGPRVRNELRNKYQEDCAYGILNAPDPSFNPAIDKLLAFNYTPADQRSGKSKNKHTLQKELNLSVDAKAPIFFWPSRLDSIQKGSQLMAEILHRVITTYWEMNLQVVFVANGEYQQHFKDIVAEHHFESRVAVKDFDERLEHLSYAASDFILMPSLFEPCGLPQMIAPIYGVLPIARDTGGIHDTIVNLNVEKNYGNGFLFETYDSNGLFWAIGEAMKFFGLSDQSKAVQIERIMEQSLATFNYGFVARQYMHLYETMLHRPLIKRDF